MKIICAGFWKTGTKSLAKALRLLGYKVYDYDDQLFEVSSLWNKFLDGSVTDDDIREQLADIDVLIDGPVIAFWEEIHRAIPDTKVILTTRDEDSWWGSFAGATRSAPGWTKFLFYLMFLTPTGHTMMRVMMRVAHFCQGVEGPFKTPIMNVSDNPRLYKAQFRKHNCHVIHTVKKEKLLVFKSADGWQPLCEFTGNDVPLDVPFPHQNKKNAHFKSEGGPQNPKYKRALIETMVIFAVLIGILAWLIHSVLSHYFY